MEVGKIKMLLTGRGWNETTISRLAIGCSLKAIRLTMINTKGFTLIELIVVLVIIGLTTVLTVPALSRQLNSLKLKTSAREMSAIARHVREQAILKQFPQWVGLDLGKDLYWVGEGIAEEEFDSENKKKKIVTLPAEVDLKGFEWMNKVEDITANWIQFYPDGSSSGGLITLVNRKGKGVAEIHFNPFTGLATVKIIYNQ